MSLKEKAQNWTHTILRAVIFFAVLGAIMMIFAITMLSKTFSDITNTLSPATPPTTSTDKH